MSVEKPPVFHESIDDFPDEDSDDPGEEVDEDVTVPTANGFIYFYHF